MRQFLDVSDHGPGCPHAGDPWTEPVTKMEFTWLEALGLWVGKYMVTNGQWRQFRPEHDSGSLRGLSLNEDRQPVVCVSFDDAMAFAEWLTRQARERRALPPEWLLRVPSDLEWTTYARCGDGREYPWGNEWPPRYGNYGDEAGKRAFPDWEVITGYDDGFAVTCPVELAGVNDWGLYGVGGNAYEWTFQAGGTETELRGGSFSTYQPEYLKLSNCYRREPSSHLINFGARLVLVPGR